MMKIPSKKQAASALVIGILGTAIWEKILSPLCTYIYIKISSLIDKFATTFSNNTYMEISKGYHDSIAVSIVYYLVMFIFVLSFAIYVTYLVVQKKTMLRYIWNEDVRPTHKEIKSKLERSFFFFIPIYLFMIIFMYWIGNLTFITNCRTSSLCNLEIICPYVSDLEYKDLKSSFYSIKTKEDYESFTNTIKEIGKKYNLNLR